ncbi:ribose-5-phosphate isomerase RpiA [Sphingomonas sp. Leaf257]|jgi:ribose 5-phosphate isomerase A|uniref:ribose-5-phosphate isomerase RpiA n=1 Tax=Sphingomonas sp. Leaf257 TaxID=1736309 RepID=UPI0006F3C12C|nr:ribose-5-phosphate isomerase RpiA [Sphingomonas sp. Leaf257]KQO55629.1 ribose 5-phosphate isomerase [Sphingomonas sp. Leaf257]
MTDRDADKRLAAAAAVDEVCDNMLVGLGTGSTAAHVIALLAERGLTIETVATSRASTELAERLGLKVRPFDTVVRVDLAIDGADAIDADLSAVKGAGGAMLREKIVAAAADRMIVIADGSKRVERLQGAKLPIEILPFARAFAVERLSGLFERLDERTGYLTDNGNIVVDGHGWNDADLPGLAEALAAIPGVVGHGLFLSEIDAAYIADNGVVTRLERGRNPR